MKPKIQVIYSRRQLRIQDHPLIHAASKIELPTVFIYAFEPNTEEKKYFPSSPTGVYRDAFIREALIDLQEGLKKINIPLWVCEEGIVRALELLREKVEIEKVITSREWLSEEMHLQHQITMMGIPIETYYCDFLIHPDQLPFSDTLPKMFTSFRQEMEKRPLVLEEIISHKYEFPSWPFPIFSVPAFTYQEQLFPINTSHPFRGGETAAHQRMANYFSIDCGLLTYKETRNGLIGADYSSKLSSYLAIGNISPVQIIKRIKEFEQQVKANESTYWLGFEILWREYFRHVSLEKKNQIFFKRGINGKSVFIQPHLPAVQKWKSGQTANSFINAGMNELRKTGYLSNRMRQIVASYFIHDLKQDWRIGAAWFEELLVDYDPHSNWCNWMYIAGVGNDPRPVRKFNPLKQQEQYDPHQSYTQLWNQ